MLSPEFFVEALILRGELATVCNPFRRSTYTVSSIQNEKSDPFPIGKGSDYLNLVEEGGFEPPKRNVTDLQSAPFGHSGTPPYLIYLKQIKCLSRSAERRSVELVDGFEPPTC